jgi:uncharacterized protein YjhX (UPF0386 family)
MSESDSSYEVNVLDNEAYETVRLIVEMRQRVSDGAVFTLHRPMTPGDALRMGRWQSRGLKQVAYSLMVEYMRQEAKNTIQRVVDEGADLKDLTPEVFEGLLGKRVLRSTRSLLYGVVQDALGSLRPKAS